MKLPQKTSMTIKRIKIFLSISIFLSATNLHSQTVVIDNDSIITWDNYYIKEMYNQFGFFSFIQCRCYVK